MKDEKKRKLAGKALALLLVIGITGAALMSCGGNDNAQKYVDEKIGFSFEYPADFKEVPVQAPTELKRFAQQNEFMMPVFTVSLKDGPDSAPLSEVPDRIIASMAAGIPGSSGFKLLEKDSKKLGDGSEAVNFQFEWTWVDGKTVMQSVFTAAYKGSTLVMISGTTLRDLGYPLKDISKYCRTLRLSL